MHAARGKKQDAAACAHIARNIRPARGTRVRGPAGTTHKHSRCTQPWPRPPAPAERVCKPWPWRYSQPTKMRPATRDPAAGHKGTIQVRPVCRSQFADRIDALRCVASVFLNLQQPKNTQTSRAPRSRRWSLSHMLMRHTGRSPSHAAGVARACSRRRMVNPRCTMVTAVRFTFVRYPITEGSQNYYPSIINI